MASRLLITGASGQLGAYLLQYLAAMDRFEVSAWSGSHATTLFGFPLCPVDLGRPQDVEAAFADARPNLVIHAAAISRIDICYNQPELARRINVLATQQLASLAARRGARLVYLSTDLVFDGRKGNYGESDPAIPLSQYGRSKLEAESAVVAMSGGLVARVSLLFGPALNGRSSFFEQQCAALRGGQSLTLFEDEWRTPLSLATAARALVALAESRLPGVVHVGGPERLSRWEMGQRLAKSLGCDPSTLQTARQSQGQFAEPRPSDVSLDSKRWRTLFPQQPWPAWDQALAEMLPTR